MSFLGFLFRFSRIVADAKAFGSGNPKKIARRFKNKVKGRLLARVGFWR